MTPLSSVAIINQLKRRFTQEVDTSFFEHFNDELILKVPFQNMYVFISGWPPSPTAKIIFFKSNYKEEKILEDCFETGIAFYPKTIDHLKSIIDCIDVY